MLKCHEIYWIIFRKRIRTTGVDGCSYCLQHTEAGLCIHALVDHLFKDELLPEPRLTICDMDHSKTIRRSLDENHFFSEKSAFENTICKMSVLSISQYVVVNATNELVQV